MVEAVTAGRAATVSLDRYAGAAAAGDLLWASHQAAALLYHKKRMGQHLLMAADRIETLLQIAQNEGWTDEVLQVEHVKAYQQVLATTGYQQGEIDVFKALGMTDAEIDRMRQQQIAADPNAVTLSRRQYYTNLAQVFRELGEVLANPPNFTGSPTKRGEALKNGSNLTRVYEATQPFKVGNPLTVASTIDLKPRRINLPADWMVDVVPDSVTLNAGEQTTATLTVRAGAASIQGDQPRVAVEGYAGSQMIGGVVLDVLIPREVQFDASTDAPYWREYR
jgi:hypothetical protein